jgi:mRNA-degrading endonuclease RelE of RelBE toxin-antitoxin system
MFPVWGTGDVLIVPVGFDRTLPLTDTPDRKLRMRSFQIIFNPTSAAELAKMPKELQLQILGEFRGLPHQVMSTELEEFGKLERAGRILHRFRIGDYRVYFEKHELGVVVHRILSRHTLKDFLFRSGLKMDEDVALQQNPKFWEMIEAAKSVQA